MDITINEVHNILFDIFSCLFHTDNVSNFSSVCYLYGTLMNKNLGVPIGLIDSSWGGTYVEAWSPPKSLHACGLKHEDKYDQFRYN